VPRGERGEVVTVAVRRERLLDSQNRGLLDYIDLNRYTILPNTAGCFSAEDAVRVARLGRELLANLGNPGADWVKLEVLGDKTTLLPDPLATVEATKVLVKDGFRVLVYTTDDPITARRLKEAGAACVMPAGSPIGSGQGVLQLLPLVGGQGDEVLLHGGLLPVRSADATGRQSATQKRQPTRLVFQSPGGPARVILGGMADVTHILNAIEQGDPQAAADLLPLVYEELRKLAAARLAEEKPGQTLQATALVHEAYLRLVGRDADSRWSSRGHFFAAAAEAMRRILVDNARRKRSEKRGRDRVSLDLDQLAATTDHLDNVLDIDAALLRLANTDPQAAELVKLRYFAGLSIPQAAAVLGVSPRSADFLWAYARVWLLRSLGGAGAQA
jgi:RNA polymerase sigma factor (TIGR02999 family)